jgi:dienelactone hydrolase
MKKSFFLFVFVLFFTPFFGQEILGSWAGELAIQGTKLPIIFNVKSNEAGLTTTMDSPAQKAKDIPVAKTTFDKTELTIDASNLGILYKGTLLNDKIEGIFSQGGMSLPLVLSKKKEAIRPQTPKAPFDYTSEEVTFINPIDLNTLAGTLTTPKNKKNVPVVILITGSGQQNRDSEIFGHKSFWVVADDFTKKGIAVLRLDDRGIGGSNKGNNTTPTSQNFATDINAAVNFLALKGFKNIGLAGHSEGGMIAPVVASQNNKVKFVISLAGPGIPIEELLQLQSRAVAKLDGASEADLKMNEELNRKLYAIIKNPKSSDLKTEIKTILLEDLKKIPKEQ